MTIAEVIAQLAEYPGEYKFLFTIDEDAQLRFEAGSATLDGPFQFDCNDEARVVYVSE